MAKSKSPLCCACQAEMAVSVETGQPVCPQCGVSPDWLKTRRVKGGQWQYVPHSNIEVQMRPGWDWRGRVYNALIRHGWGYRGDLAVFQVKGKLRDDPPKILPMYPGMLADIIQTMAIEEFQKSGRKLDEQQRKKLRPEKGNLRFLLEELEKEDGVLIRCRINGDRAQVRNFRDVGVTLSLEQAIAAKLVTPVSKLDFKERRKCADRVIIYILPSPNPATIHALTRHQDYPLGSAITLPSTDKANAANTTFQYLFAFMKRRGFRDPQLAEALLALPVIQEGMQSLQHAERDFEELMLKKAKELKPETPRADRPHPPKTSEELAPIAAELGRWRELQRTGHGWEGPALVFDDTYVKKLFAEAREFHPTCTPEQVAIAIDNRLRLKVGKPESKIHGYLMKEVPRFLSSANPSPASAPAHRTNATEPGREAGEEYASGRDHLKAIFFAKAGYHAPVDLLDRLESILVGKGKTFEEFVEALRIGQHLGNYWRTAPGFLTDKARSIFEEPASPAQLKPKPRCPECFAQDHRGSVLRGGAIVPCPTCSTSSEWAAELTAKLKPREQTERAAS